MSKTTKVICIILACLPFSAAWGEWPVSQHQSNLLAIADASGSIRNPTLTWSFDTRGEQALFSIALKDGERNPKYRFKELRDPGYWGANQAQWGRIPETHVLSPDGKIQRSGHANNEQIGDFLPEIPGLERFTMRSQSGTGDELAKGQLFKYQNGKEELVWETEEIHTHYSPMVLLADATGDGSDEIILALHYRIYVFDPKTGETLMWLRYHDYRNYGFFGAQNLDETPQAEFINIADFQSHIDVLRSDGKELSVIWRKDIEANIDRKKRIVRPGPDPIRDLDNDGRFEIVFNYHNENGDNLWHTVAWDALTGDVVFDWAGTYLNAIHDLDGDGIDELFLSKTDGLYVPKFAPIEIVRFSGDRKQRIWSLESGRFPFLDQVDFPKDRATGATLGNKTVPIIDWNGDRISDIVVFRRTPYDAVVLEGYTYFDNGFDKEFFIELPHGFNGEIMGVQDDRTQGGPKALLSLNVPRVRPEERVAFVVEDAEMELVSQHQVDGQLWNHPWTDPKVGKLGNHRVPTILTPGGPGEILAIQPPNREQPDPKVIWSRHGSRYFLMADTDGKGDLEVVYVSEGSDGQGRAVCVNEAGHPIWETDLFGFPGVPNIWNTAGVTSLFAGKFTGVGFRTDIFLTARRSTMHSNEGFVLSGEDGSLIWRRDSIGDEWGVGGTWVAAANTNERRGEEVVSLYPVCFSILDGPTGEELVYKNMAVDYFPGVWAAYGAPVVADWFGDGGEAEVYHALGYGAGVSTLQAERVWSTQVPTAFPAKFDVDGDGFDEIIACEYPSRNVGPSPKGFVARNIRSGSDVSILDWEIPNGGVAHLVTVDIDSDGNMDGVFTSGNLLGAITARDGELTKLWEMTYPENVGPPAVTDLDMDGKVEILVYGNSGVIYAVDEAPGSVADSAR